VPSTAEYDGGTTVTKEQVGKIEEEKIFFLVQICPFIGSL